MPDSHSLLIDLNVAAFFYGLNKIRTGQFTMARFWEENVLSAKENCLS